MLPYRSPDSGDLVPEATLGPTIPSASLSDLGNFRIGARYKAIDKKVVFSVQLDLELPTGTQDEVTGLSTGYDAVTVAPTVSVGRGWRRAYVFGYLGLGYRTNDFSSIGVAGAEAGIRFFGRLWLVGMLSIVESFRNGDVVLPQSNLETGLFVNDQEYFAYGLKGLVEITDRVGIQLTYYTASSGNNVPRSPLFGTGVYFKW